MTIYHDDVDTDLKCTTPRKTDDKQFLVQISNSNSLEHIQLGKKDGDHCLVIDSTDNLLRLRVSEDFAKFFNRLDDVVCDMTKSMAQTWFGLSKPLEDDDIHRMHIPTVKNSQIEIQCSNALRVFKLDHDEEGKHAWSQSSVVHVEPDSYVIPLIDIKGILFTSKNFHINYVLTDILILDQVYFPFLL